MSAQGVPTPLFRTVKRKNKLVRQQRWSVSFDAGSSKETTRFVWLDEPEPTEEPPQDVELRSRVEALGANFRRMG